MYLTIPCIAFMICLYGASTDNTTDYIHQLELKISDLESHSLASEQKQAAVLASILSRIQSQEQKIQSQEQKIQSQDQKIQSQDQKIQSQQYNETADVSSILSKLQSQEQQIQELKNMYFLLDIMDTGQKVMASACRILPDSPQFGRIKQDPEESAKNELENATKTHCSSASSSGFQTVVFEARTSHDLDETSKIYFNQVSTNVGGAYSSKTGVFTAPRNGTFLIWFRVILQLPSTHSIPVIKVTGGRGATVFSSYFPSKNLSKHNYVYKVIQDVRAVSLVKGEPVSLTLSPPTKVKFPSTFSGVLLGNM